MVRCVKHQAHQVEALESITTATSTAATAATAVTTATTPARRRALTLPNRLRLRVRSRSVLMRMPAALTVPSAAGGRFGN